VGVVVDQHHQKIDGRHVHLSQSEEKYMAIEQLEIIREFPFEFYGETCIKSARDHWRTSIGQKMRQHCVDQSISFTKR
jgi:hypothetical protein